MPDYSPLLTAAEQVAATADGLGRTFARELARVQIDLERELRRLILKAQEGSVTASALAVRALGLRRQIREVLEAAGYDNLAAVSTVRGLDRMVEAMGRLRLAAKVASFTSRDATRIAALKELARLDVLAQGDEVGIALWRSLLQGLYSQRKPNDILDDLATALDRELVSVRTLYDTYTSVFGRQVEAMKAGDDPESLFAYVGPADSKVRPFCKAHLGMIYSRSEIDALDNGQLPNCFLTAGGYQCRHSFVAISKFSELADLHGTGQRIPEIADQLKGVPVRAKAA